MLLFSVAEKKQEFGRKSRLPCAHHKSCFFLEFIRNVPDLTKNNRGEGIVIPDVNDFFLPEN